MTHCKRSWEIEDITHLDDIISLEISRGILSLPGLESIRDQLALRFGEDVKYEDHDHPKSSHERSDP